MMEPYLPSSAIFTEHLLRRQIAPRRQIKVRIRCVSGEMTFLVILLYLSRIIFIDLE